MNKEFKHLFHIPKDSKTGKEVVYLCGHSLGLQPKGTRASVEKELAIWQNDAVEGHFRAGSPWYTYHEIVSDSLARLIGAEKSEVVAMNSLTTNLHLMLISFFRPSQGKNKILTDFPCFPSDKYALDSALKSRGLDPSESLIKIETLQNDHLITTDELIACIEKHPDASLLYLNPVNYLTGQVLDIEAVSKVCSRQGIVLGLDLAHAIGNIELKLSEWNADFAIWCSYKYLNGGPGAIGGCYVNKKHHLHSLPRLEGWWGTNSDTRFNMNDNFDSAMTADAWQLSNPPILMLAALRASLDIFDTVSMNQLMAKGRSLGSRFIERIQKSGLNKKLTILNAEVNRGNMLSMRIKDPSRFNQLKEHLMENHIVVDYRKPDVMRASFCPLYNTVDDVDHWADSLEKILSIENG